MTIKFAFHFFMIEVERQSGNAGSVFQMQGKIILERNLGYRTIPTVKS